MIDLLHLLKDNKRVDLVSIDLCTSDLISLVSSLHKMIFLLPKPDGFDSFIVNNSISG